MPASTVVWSMLWKRERGAGQVLKLIYGSSEMKLDLNRISALVSRPDLTRNCLS